MDGMPASVSSRHVVVVVVVVVVVGTAVAKAHGCAPNVITYSAAISACEKGGADETERALELLTTMQWRGVAPDNTTYVRTHRVLLVRRPSAVASHVTPRSGASTRNTKRGAVHNEANRVNAQCACFYAARWLEVQRDDLGVREGRPVGEGARAARRDGAPRRPVRLHHLLGRHHRVRAVGRTGRRAPPLRLRARRARPLVALEGSNDVAHKDTNRARL